MCVQNSVKLSAAVHELSTSELDFGYCKLWSRISLEWIKQSTSGKRRYELRFFFHIRWKQFG